MNCSLLERADQRRGLRVLRVVGDLNAVTASGFTERATRSIGQSPGPVRVDLSGLTSVDAPGGFALAAVLEAIPPERLVSVDFCRARVRRVLEQNGLHLGHVPPGTVTVPEDETPRLVDQVREARLHAGEARQQAVRNLARVSRTAARVASTQQRTAGTREQGRRLIASRKHAVLPPRVRASLPQAAPARPGRAGPSGRYPTSLDRAVAFIEDHADRDLTVADIAAASFVTVRAVQLAFRQHLGMTPVEYLRQVRLDRAHQDLVTADPARESVTAVASRWQFASPSRFAAYYRRTFGIVPSRTLRS